MAGNHKVTTQTKIIRGTFRKDRHGNKLLVPNEKTLPLPPKGKFRKETEAHWMTVVKTLQSQKILQSIGLRLLTSYFEQVELYEDALDDVKENGRVIEYLSPRNGPQIRENPNVKIANEALKAMILLSNQFGFTPLAQTKINTNLSSSDKGKDEEGDGFNF